MYVYISAYKKEELDKMTKDDLKYVLGIVYNNTVIKPPICKVCGCFLLEDYYYGQCDECGRLYKLYISKNMKDWYEDESYM